MSTILLFTGGSATIFSDPGDYTLELDLEFIHLDKSFQLVNNLPDTLFLVKNFYGSTLHLTNAIRQEATTSFKLFNSMLVGEPTLFKSQRCVYSIFAGDAATSTYSIEYKVLLDGMDVTYLVDSCTINYQMGSFTADIDIVWNHPSLYQLTSGTTLYDLIDCSDLTLNYQIERLEVYTRVASDETPVWTLQGSFFLEKRGTTVTYNATVPTSWGRNRPARLATPYAVPLTKVWSENTTAKAIAQELCDAAGVTLSWEIADFRVLGSNVRSDGGEPIEIITQLAEVLGGVLTCTKDGTLRVVYRFFA